MTKEILRFARRAVLLAALTLAAALMLGAQQGTQAPAESSTATAPTPHDAAEDARPSQATSQYRIGPRDVLTIRVTAPDVVPQFSADALEVDECGMIPLLSVQNAGLTTGELQEQLRKFYLKYKRNPQVVVKVREYNSQPVAINGAVMKPGLFQMRRPVRLLELLTFYAGGPTERNGGRIQLARTPALGECASAQQVAAASSAQAGDPPAPQFLLFDLSDTLKGGEQANPYLQPGDVITLPEAKEAYVIGNVLRPGPVMLKDDNLTVTRALAMAGGLMPDTKKDKVRVIRVDASGGSRQEVNRRDEDITLRPNDILDIPVSGGKRLLRSIIGGGAASAGQLPIRIIP